MFADGTRALADLNLHIADGELMVLVGPSGCGKTTALRIVAGLDDATSGEVRIGERVVNDVAPKDRDIAMVFQSYALYPHLTVFENMAFGLRLRKTPKAEVERRVQRAAEVLSLQDLLQRKPRALSGGQRQRVAMGRAIVRQPQAFLMDEPLSNLDAKLRVQMRAEIARLQRELGVTTVYVTHDQVEAMTLGDRVAVMRRGVLQQVAAPQELYDGPENLFVAGFIGSPAMNLLTATVEQRDGRWNLAMRNEQSIAMSDDVVRPNDLARFDGRSVAVGIRPEDITDASEADARQRDASLNATVELVEALGSDVFVHARVDADPVVTEETRELAEDVDPAQAADLLSPARGRGTSVIARCSPRSQVAVGASIHLALDPTRIHLFDPETGSALASARKEHK